MADIFDRASTTLSGVFSSDSGRLSFGAGVSTVLVQNFSATYMQNVTRLYEVGNLGETARVYYVGGRAQGQLQIARVIGPSVLLSQYYKKYGSVCNAKTNNMTFTLGQSDCSVNTPANFVGPLQEVFYTCKYCVITQIGLSVAAADMIINESSALMYSGMEYGGP